MKKESIAKKILVSSLMGFPVGIALLMIAYICIYYIIGENIFRTEIGNLQNIETLISQMLTIGLSYYILFIHFHIFLHLYNKDVNDKINKHLYKTVSISLLSFIELIIAVILASTEKVFTKNISLSE